MPVERGSEVVERGRKKRRAALRRSRKASPGNRASKDCGSDASATGGDTCALFPRQNGVPGNVSKHQLLHRFNVRRLTPVMSRSREARWRVSPWVAVLINTNVAAK